MATLNSFKKDAKSLLGNTLLQPNNTFIIGSEALFDIDTPHTQGTGDSAFWMYNLVADLFNDIPEEAARPTNEHNWHILLRSNSIKRDLFEKKVIEKHETLFEDYSKYVCKELLDFIDNAIRLGLIDSIFTTAVDRCLLMALKPICKKYGKNLTYYNFKVDSHWEDYDNRDKNEEFAIVYLFGLAGDKNDDNEYVDFVFTEDDAMQTIAKYIQISVDNKKTLYEKIFSNHRIISIGCRFDDWKFRFFWYAMRGYFDESAKGTVAYTCKEPEKDPLYTYLKDNKSLRLVNNSRDFLKELVSIIEEKGFFDRLKNLRQKGGIFISYASEDLKQSAQIFEALQSEHYKVWIDYYGLRPLDKYTHEIERAIQECDIFIPVLSSQTKKDLEFGNERFYMTEWEMARKNGRVIAPITIGEYSVRENYHTKFREFCGFKGEDDITIKSLENLDEFKSVIRDLIHPQR